MRTSYDRDSYHPSSFDDELCLKPPALIWFVTLYLSRAILMPLVVGLGHYAGVNRDAMALLRAFWREDTLLPAMLAAPVLYALCRRQGSASRAVRWIWDHGRVLLAGAAAADILLNVYDLIPFTKLDDAGVMPLAAAMVDAFFLTYVLAARRVRDAFCDFPGPVER
jgi:hypothetical protein